MKNISARTFLSLLRCIIVDGKIPIPFETVRLVDPILERIRPGASRLLRFSTSCPETDQTWNEYFRDVSLVKFAEKLFRDGRFAF